MSCFLKVFTVCSSDDSEDASGSSEGATVRSAMPALLMRKVDHVGKKGSGAFHAILSAKLPYGSTTEETTILLKLSEAYDEFGQPEVWAVAREWLKTMGVQ